MRNTKDEIERTCREIERLTQYLAELVVEDDDEREVERIKIGDRVEVTLKDKYYGRRGQVTEMRSRTGPMWYVELEATEHKGRQRIWKTEKYLKVLKKPEQNVV